MSLKEVKDWVRNTAMAVSDEYGMEKLTGEMCVVFAKEDTLSNRDYT
jgi:hypothetical protein